MPGVVKFTANLSYSKVEFLDLVIKIGNGKLKTDLFIKPSNLQLYLNYDSNHPEPCKTGLVYGQALRVIERCTDAQESHREPKRKAHKKKVTHKIHRAKTKDRKCQIYKTEKNKQKTRLDFFLLIG